MLVGGKHDSANVAGRSGFTGAGSKKSTGALGVFTVMLVTILMA
jgi:hypothetical protein